MSEEAKRAELPPDRLTALWQRVKAHRIAQWTVGYVAVAYGIQHAVTLTSEAFDWPHAVARVTMLLLALGLPVAMTLAWYHGERVSRRATRGEMAIVSVMLVGISLVFYLFVRPGGDVTPRAQAPPAAAAPVNGISVAVLPLANVSGDKDQEFFSDGMTDEIMSALAKVAALRVVGRESAFEFKGKTQNDRAIGRVLGARYLVEGSVRKAGDRVRITAQLVRAEDGVSLWTENYDRDLKDVFAVQEDVARAIAASLRVPLGLKQGVSLVPSRTVDLDSYQDYLRARALERARGLKPLTDATALLEKVVAHDPDYAPGWALLAQAYSLTPNGQPAFRSGSVAEVRRFVDVFFPKAEAAARRAIQLDANLADGYVSLGHVQRDRGKLLLAEDLFKQALTLDPNDPDALHWYADVLAGVGRLKEALAMQERLRVLEPFVPIFNLSTADVMWLNGQNDAAISILKDLPVAFRAGNLAMIQAAMDHYGEAADTLLEIPSGDFLPGVVEEAARLLRTAPQKVALSQRLPQLGFLGWVYFYVGAPNQVLEDYQDRVEVGYENPSAIALLWHSSYAPLRKTEQFKAFVRKAGLVDYWRARGWPELCHPVGADDFVCS